MSRTLTTVPVGYFGKIPSRGDFVKGGANPALIKVLDDWLAQAMDLMSADARWKLYYDAVAPLYFAFMGPRRRQAIAGYVVASSDQSQRRFPFLTVASIDVADPTGFVPNAPLVLGRLWRTLESESTSVTGAPDPTEALVAAAAKSIDVDLQASAYDAAFDDFQALHTVGSLDQLLAQSGFSGAVRQVLLALGLLLQPVMASSSSRLDKSLVLPLPNDPMYRNLVAAFWMHLITPFLARADFELALFVTRLADRPALVLGFSGASAATLRAIMDPQAGLDRHIGFDQLDWVEQQVDADYAIKKLSAYLAQPSLSLTAARTSLHAAFLGT